MVTILPSLITRPGKSRSKHHRVERVTQQLNAFSSFSIYTWSPDIPQRARDLGLRPLPMLWGHHQIQRFQQLVHAGYAQTVLGMNEYVES